MRMQSSFKTTITAAICAMSLVGGVSAVEALPLSGAIAAGQTSPAPSVERVYYRCGYYGCHYRRYGYYRPHYRSYYYRPYGYYYRPRLFGVF